MKRVYRDIETGARAELDPRDDLGGWLLAVVRVPPNQRGKGAGGRLLRLITAAADRDKVDLYLYPASDGGLPQKELEAWYRRHGFYKSGTLWVRHPAARHSI